MGKKGLQRISWMKFQFGISTTIWGENLMLLAVKDGHEAIVRVLLDKGIGPDPSSRPRRERPFYYAVRRGHVVVARMLLANETNGGYRRVDKLFIDAIVSAGSLPMVKFLVEEMRCDPKLEEAMSPFMLAAEHDWVDILQYLLELGLNVNTDDSNVTGNAMKTAICYSAKKGQSNAVLFLIEHGADLNPMRGEEPITMLPLREAMDDERIETAKLLLDHMDLSTLPTDHDGQAMFICIAAASSSEALVERLLKHGCDPEAISKTCGDLGLKFEDDCTASVWAATFGHVSVLEMLLDHGAALKYPYLAAVHARQMQIVKLLLARGVDPNCWRSDDENDILSPAAADESMFKFLLEHGADIWVDKDGDSLLREAILCNNLAVAGMVLGQRVEPEDERKVLERAAAWDTSGVLALLFQRGIVSGRPKYYRSTKAVELALEAHNAPALKILLENGWCLSDPELYRSHQRDGSQDIIYHAFQARSPEEIESMLDILFSNGVQINRTVRNTTNTWFPILERDAYSLKLLLERVPDPFHLTEDNETPLLYAVNRNFAAGIKLLLEAIVSSERIWRRKLAEDVHFALAWALNGVKWNVARVLRWFYYHDLDGTALIAPPSHRQAKDKRDMDEQERAMKYFGPDI